MKVEIDIVVPIGHNVSLSRNRVLSNFINRHWDGHAYFFRDYKFVRYTKDLFVMSTDGMSVTIKELNI